MILTQQCGICQKDSKYKCTKCRFPFCSVVCGNEHRDSPACQVPAVDNESTAHTEPNLRLMRSEDEKKLEASLRNSSKLRELFKNRKLRDMIVAIDSAPNAPAVLDTAMADPDFMEFVQACLEVTAEPEPT